MQTKHAARWRTAIPVGGDVPDGPLYGVLPHIGLLGVFTIFTRTIIVSFRPRQQSRVERISKTARSGFGAMIVQTFLRGNEIFLCTRRVRRIHTTPSASCLGRDPQGGALLRRFGMTRCVVGCVAADGRGRPSLQVSADKAHRTSVHLVCSHPLNASFDSREVPSEGEAEGLSGTN